MFALKRILHFGKRQRKRVLPDPVPGLKLVFRKGAVETIKRAKGWVTDSDMAYALGITRAYVSMMSKRRISVSHTIILRLAYLLGNLRGNWWIFYEIVNTGEAVDFNHPLWNEDKYHGRIPYDYFSSSADLRSQDYVVERRNFSQQFQRNSKVKRHK